MLKLHTIIVSTRPTRIGPVVARWFHELAQSHAGFDAELIDLADFQLPLYDEPHHPVQRRYQHEHTKKWAASVQQADAVVFVLPEYNYSPPPSIVNAMDYVFWEWQYKPMGLVSYGGASGGLRSAQATRLQASTLKMMPIPEGVAIPFVTRQISEGKFEPNDPNTTSATNMLDELLRWSEALAPLREQNRKERLAGN